MQNICFAQNLDVISELEKNIAQSKIDSCTPSKRPSSCNEIPGSILTTALSDELNSQKSKNQCSETAETKKKKKNAKTEVFNEVLLIAELNTNDTAAQLITNSSVKNLRHIKTNVATNSTMLIESILNIPKTFLNSKDISDDTVADQAAQLISEHASTDEEKINLLGELSKRLYKNYNDKRNPNQNVNDDDIPKGSISLSDMFSAASANNKDRGGVCNDISISVAQVAQKVFPKKDVLVINNGTHFGVMLHDKDSKGQIIEGGGNLVTNISDPIMDGRFPVPTSRLLKLDGHILKQIAVVDTEVGVVLKKTIQTQTDVVSTSANPSLILANYKTQVKKHGKTKTYEIKAGAANTSNSNILIIVAQNSRETEKYQSTLALSALQQDIKNADQKNIILALHTGIQRTIIKYQNPKLVIKAQAGAEADVSYGFQSNVDKQSPLNEIMPIAATLQVNQTVDFATRPANEKNPALNGRFQVAQDFGSMNEGARQGTMPDPGAFRAALDSMKYMGFSLNQVKADVNLNIPIKPNLTSFSQLRYQGTNIYQDFSIMSGFQIISDGGQTLMAYIGYQDTAKGYKTNSTLSTRPSGAITGGGYKTNNGLEVNANVQVSPNANNPVQTNIGVKKTFGGKKKKK
jgi:hypothetical protein